MKYLILIFFLASLLLGLISCGKCKTCTQYNEYKQAIKDQKLCGEDLKKAEQDTAHYKCK